MNKLILDFEEQNSITNEDVIVFDTHKMCWVNMKKDVFLGKIKRDIDKTNERIDKTNADVNKLRLEIKEIANITLEDLRK